MTSTTASSNMSKIALDQIKKNLAKRTFNVKFDLDETEYKPLENIGIGAYGVVCSAVHKKSQDKVAIKKIPHVFEALTVTKRTYREIKILKHFKHDNIISIREILKPREDRRMFQDIYVVFDLMESDLHRIIYTEQELTEEHIRYFLYQILRGLKYIHSANVIHRDLKPSNLLVNEDCHVRIGDFGMARGISSTPDEACYYMTQYVATRWYRAPEILLSLVEYGTAVDMWSVGCIFAEMLGRKHLFPGKDYISQVKLILGVLGSPSEAVVKNCQNEIIKRIIHSMGHKQAVPWKTLFPKASKKAINLLSRMLTINPTERISVVKALEHPYLSKYHDPDDEPICVPTFNFDFEKEDMDKETLREVIYKEVMDFHQPKTPTLSFSAVLRPAPKAEPPEEAGKPMAYSEQVDNLLQVLAQQTGEVTKTEDTKGQKPVQTSLKEEKNLLQESLVTVDTKALLPPQSADVEMLSARSTDGKQEMDTQCKQEPEVKLEVTVPQQQQQQSENKTVSMGTKALIKQALLNASQRRQRKESGSEEGEGKPKAVTAAQRQKEREEKRRKKKERAMKRQKDKQNADQKSYLSSEDKELLRRWMNMQPRLAPAGVTVAPAPVTHSMAISLQGTQLTLTPISQAATVIQTQQAAQTQQQTVIQPKPRTVMPSQTVIQTQQQTVIPSQTVIQTQQQTVVPSQTVIQTQQQTVMPSQTVIQSQQQTVMPTQTVIQTQQQTVMPSQTVIQQQTQQPQTQTVLPAGQVTQPPSDLIPTSQDQTQSGSNQTLLLATRQSQSPPSQLTHQSQTSAIESVQHGTQNLSLSKPSVGLIQDGGHLPVSHNPIQTFIPPSTRSSCMFQSAASNTQSADFHQAGTFSVTSASSMPPQVHQFNTSSTLLCI